MAKKNGKASRGEVNLSRYVDPFRVDGSREFHLKFHKTDEKGGLDKDTAKDLLDASRGPTRADEEITQRFPENVPVLRVWNKIDVSGHKPAVDRMPDATHIYLSATERRGVDLLRVELLRAAGWQQTGESRFLARERHLLALKAAREHLDLAAQYAAKDSQVSDQALDLLAEELRLAQERLNSITGEFTSDDLLGVIFSRFCIGK